MKALGPQLLIIISLTSLAGACGQRTADTPTLGSTGIVPASNATDASDRTAELEKLIRDQSDALNKLSTDKATLQERSTSLETQVKSLTDQLATNKTLTDQQKTDMQKQIADLTTQKADLDKQIALLNQKNVDLQKQLDDAKAQNAALQKQLNDAKAAAANGTTTTTTPVASTAKYHQFKYADPTKAKNDCLDVPGSNTGENVQLIAYPCNANAQNQQYEVLDPKNQFFIIRARFSGKCVTASSTAENASILQKTCNNGAEQSWEFYVRGQTDFRLRNAYSGKCLKIASDGKMIQGDCNTNSTYFNWIDAI